jgi:putative Holliday junction resolvase
MTKPIDIGTRIGFDFGEKRIGVATSDSESILVSPHATILNDDKLAEKLTEIFHERIKEEDIKFKQLCFYVND